MKKGISILYLALLLVACTHTKEKMTDSVRLSSYVNRTIEDLCRDFGESGWRIPFPL